MYCNYIYMFFDFQVFDRDDPRNNYVLCIFQTPRSLSSIFVHFGQFLSSTKHSRRSFGGDTVRVSLTTNVVKRGIWVSTHPSGFSGGL